MLGEDSALSLLVALAILRLFLLDLAALVEGPRQIARHLDMHRRAVRRIADNGIDDLARLIERAQHDRVARNVHVLGEHHATIFVAPRVERRQILVLALADFVHAGCGE